MPIKVFSSYIIGIKFLTKFIPIICEQDRPYHYSPLFMPSAERGGEGGGK